MKHLLRFHCLVFLIGLVLPSPGYSGPLEQEISRIFPKATLIGEKENDLPVWPVYQLNELLGYVFQSNDLVDLPGFSGDPINLLIGIDTRGRFQGLTLLDHHEPIFMHGLGPQPMLDFIAQYDNRLVSDRIVIGKGQRSNESDADNTFYFDGITKATVSVIVINDTILSSALQVARNKLGDYARGAPAIAKADLFEPLSWQELLANNWVKKWVLSKPAIAETFGSALDAYNDPAIDPHSESDAITLYYAYLNTPSIGRNILGSEEFERLIASLKPNEHAFALMSDGFYSYLEDDFKPGSVPKRVWLEQQGLPITLRDLNFYHYQPKQLAPGVPGLDNLLIFKVNPQSGFDPSSEMQLILMMALRKNHLVSDSRRFQDSYDLPSQLFNPVQRPPVVTAPPPWRRIWQSRSNEILVLCLGLGLLSYVFIKQHQFSKNARRFKQFRWLYLIFTLGFIGLYAQGQLSVVNIYTLLLALINGFDLSLFLLDPIIFILWTYTLISLLLWGRGVFCGWLCPFGALQEMLSWLAKKLGIKQLKLADGQHEKLLWLKYYILAGLLLTALVSLSLAQSLAEVEPFKTTITLYFVRSWPYLLYALLLLGLGMHIHKFYCRYLCPLGAGLVILGKLHRWEWLARRAECGVPCQVCRHRCEIRAINRQGDINYDECIQCLECILILKDPKQCAPEMTASKRRAPGLNSPYAA